MEDIEGKGRGLVLTKDVEAGTLLVKEQALMVLGRDKVAYKRLQFSPLSSPVVGFCQCTCRLSNDQGVLMKNHTIPTVGDPGHFYCLFVTPVNVPAS